MQKCALRCYQLPPLRKESHRPTGGSQHRAESPFDAHCVLGWRGIQRSDIPPAKMKRRPREGAAAAREPRRRRGVSSAR